MKRSNPKRSAFGWLFLLVCLAAAALFARDYVRSHPQDVPWTALDLLDPVGKFTSSKLVGLADEPERCRRLLSDAGLDDIAVPPRTAGDQCGYVDGMRVEASGARDIAFTPPALVTSCPVAAALFILEEQVIQPAAMRHFGSRVVAIEHAGSYSCRRLYGRDEGPFSEHATADAIDIAGFRLADGRPISVLADWEGDGAKAAFLHAVRDGACDLFATVLSPDYNAAHADHLHFDQADRGRSGWTLCR